MPEPQAPLPRRLAWFVGLWAAGVGVVGAVGVLLRTWLLG
jgi:hypothetical protein